MSDKCKSCGRDIEWRVNDKTGKAAPIDVEPNPDGNITRLPDGRYHVKAKGDPVMDVLLEAKTYTSHYQTCPQAAEWRVKKQ